MPFLTQDETRHERQRAADGCPSAMVKLARHYCAHNYLGDAAYFLREAHAAGAPPTDAAAQVARRCGDRLPKETRAHFEQAP